MHKNRRTAATMTPEAISDEPATCRDRASRSAGDARRGECLASAQTNGFRPRQGACTDSADDHAQGESPPELHTWGISMSAVTDCITSLAHHWQICATGIAPSCVLVGSGRKYSR